VRTRFRRRLLSCLLVLLTVPAGAALGVGAYLLWFNLLRGQPAPLRQPLFVGVEYQRRVQRSPVPVVHHLVRVRVGTPGLHFFITPPRARSGRRLRAQTVSGFLARHRLRLAVNGDFFEPFRAHGLWDFYPKPGDPVDVFGMACSSSRCYGHETPNRPTLYISCAGRPSFHRPARLCHAISGLPLLAAGKVHTRLIPGNRHPRTAVAMDRDERQLILLVVDGRQPNYSEGVNPGELARLMRDAGAHNAINLDGGGSSALVMERDGRPVPLNSPIHTRLVGRQRPVANHLGLWAPALPR